MIESDPAVAPAVDAPAGEIASERDGERLDAVVNLCKRRGFVFQSAEIYGGFRSTYDYGPVGVLMLRNVKDAWWRAMVQMRPDVVGIDAAILSPPAVWEASGHLESFTDPLVECRECGRRHRQDQLDDPERCPECSSTGTLSEPRQFNLMFRTHAGPVVETGAEVYLRPETAQGMFVNFANVQRACRLRPPFGIAQIGKSFRNEITPGNFIFRTREFEQMELEFFVPPDEAPRWYEYWCAERLRWYVDLGIPSHLLRLRPHGPDERSHYSTATSDVEFRYPWGWGELEGVANRTDYDLRRHAEHSGERLEYFDSASGERYVPHVIEPAAGATRALMAFLLAAHDTEEVRGETRTVLRLPPPPGPLPGGGAAAVQEGAAHRARSGCPRAPGPALDGGLRRDSVDRPPLPPSGRIGHPLLRDGRLRDLAGRCRDRARAGLDGSGPAGDRRSGGLPARTACRLSAGAPRREGATGTPTLPGENGG